MILFPPEMFIIIAAGSPFQFSKETRMSQFTVKPGGSVSTNENTVTPLGCEVGVVKVIFNTSTTPRVVFHRYSVQWSSIYICWNFAHTDVNDTKLKFDERCERQNVVVYQKRSKGDIFTDENKTAIQMFYFERLEKKGREEQRNKKGDKRIVSMLNHGRLLRG